MQKNSSNRGEAEILCELGIQTLKIQIVLTKFLHFRAKENQKKLSNRGEAEIEPGLGTYSNSKNSIFYGSTAYPLGVF